MPDLSVSVYLPVTGIPDRHPVIAFPAMELPFAVLAELPLVPAFAPGAAWFGVAFWSGVVAFGVCAGGAAGVVPGCCGVVLGVCGAVLGVEVCVPAGVPFCWTVPAGEVLLGVVWAATQIPENSNKENSIALDLMAVLRLRCICSSLGTLGPREGRWNPVESLGRRRGSGTAGASSTGKLGL